MKYQINIGDKYGRLTILKQIGSVNKKRKVECQCECGVIKNYYFDSLYGDITKSCGCLQKQMASESNTTHGMSNTKVYKSWESMKDRCARKGHKYYKNYGGRGITVCERWLEFENFYEDMRADFRDGLKLDRINNNGNYCRENCRWATQKEQCNNTRSNVNINFMGQTKSIAEWATYFGINYKAFHRRFRAEKMPFAQAIIRGKSSWSSYQINNN